MANSPWTLAAAIVLGVALRGLSAGGAFPLQSPTAWRETTEGWEALAAADAALLVLTDPLDLRDARDARLTFESWLSAGSRAAVEVSVNGITWIRAGQPPSSDTWQPVEIDLGGFLGEVISVRFVLTSAGPADPSMPEFWRVRDLDVAVASSPIAFSPDGGAGALNQSSKKSPLPR
jgi:hypothetical protein